MNALAKQLAEETGMSEADIMCMAQSVANSIKQDKAEDAFVNAPAQQQAEMTEAYAAHAQRKFDQFYTRYLTNAEARKAFIVQQHQLLAAQ